MPFFLAASAVIALLAGAKSGWRTDAQMKAGAYPVKGLPGPCWMTWVVAWQGKKIFVGPKLVDAMGAAKIERAMKEFRPGAHVFRFVKG